MIQTTAAPTMEVASALEATRTSSPDVAGKAIERLRGCSYSARSARAVPIPRRRPPSQRSSAHVLHEAGRAGVAPKHEARRKD